MRQYHVTRNGEKVDAKRVASIGDTTEAGALRVVESIWGDPENDRLLIAEEDESYASEFKVYTLAGRFTGTTFGRDVFKAQAEGVTLRTCGRMAGGSPPNRASSAACSICSTGTR